MQFLAIPWNPRGVPVPAMETYLLFSFKKDRNSLASLNYANGLNKQDRNTARREVEVESGQARE